MDRLPLKDLACTVVGFALSWYFFPPGFIALFFPGGTHVSQHLAWTAAVLICVGVFAAVAIALRDRIEEALERHHLAYFASFEVATAVGYALLFATYPLAYLLDGPWPVVSLAASVPLVAGGYAALVFAWACTMSRIPASQATPAVLAAILLYAVLSLLGLGTASTGAVLNALVPCVSGALWLAARPQPTAAAAGAARETARSSVSVLRDLPWLQVGLAALFLVGGRVIVGLFFDYSLETRQTELLLRNVLIGLVMAFMLVRLRLASDPSRQIQGSWTLVALIFLCGTMLQIALGSQANALGCGVVNAMLCCFECIAYLVLLQFVRDKGACSSSYGTRGRRPSSCSGCGSPCSKRCRSSFSAAPRRCCPTGSTSRARHWRFRWRSSPWRS